MSAKDASTRTKSGRRSIWTLSLLFALDIGGSLAAIVLGEVAEIPTAGPDRGQAYPFRNKAAKLPMRWGFLRLSGLKRDHAIT